MVDDFGFTMTGQQWVSEIKDAEGMVEPNGKFLILTVHVANHAKRVDFTFDPNQIVVESDDGRRFLLSHLGQAAQDPHGEQKTTLAAGDSCDRDIVFDIPTNANNLRMRVIFGGRFGEVLEWLFFGDRATAVKRDAP